MYVKVLHININCHLWLLFTWNYVILQEGEIPLEQLLARYGYGGQSGMEREDDESSGSSSYNSPPPTGSAPSTDSTWTQTGQTRSLAGQTSSQLDLPDLKPNYAPTSPYSRTIPPTISNIQDDTSSPVSSQLMPPLTADPSDSVENGRSDFEYAGDLLSHSFSGKGPPPLVEVEDTEVQNNTLSPHEVDLQSASSSQDDLSDDIANTDSELQGDELLSNSDSGSLLGKRTVDPVYNDVPLASKHPALQVEGGEVLNLEWNRIVYVVVLEWNRDVYCVLDLVHWGGGGGGGKKKIFV